MLMHANALADSSIKAASTHAECEVLMVMSCSLADETPLPHAFFTSVMRESLHLGKA